MSDFYEILGVDKNATKDEIKSAFRKKARQYHPDVNKAPDAEAKFKELGKAYETLMDDNKRATYDRYGEDGLKDAGFNTSGPFDGGFGDLNDIFESFFGGFGFSLPAGEYTALRLVIGEGAGQNWWCVVFPPLCTTAACEFDKTALAAGLTEEDISLITESEGYVLKFRTIELWQQLRQRIGK